LADEPTAALDKQSGRDVVNLLRKFAKEKEATILIVTHDNRILDVADRIVNMVDGRIISDVVISEAAAICEFLRKIPLFAEMPPHTLTEVADKMMQESFSPGEIVIKQGDPGEKFYLIRRGEAEVTIRRPGRDEKVVVLEEGGFFGEQALLTGEPRMATVRAKTALDLCSLDKAEFQQVLAGSTSFQERMRKVLFERQQ
jgi:putative ABC transport system ATP-binding protein